MLFKKILQFLLRKISEKFFKLKLIYLAEFFSMLRASILMGKFVKVNFDGLDWIYIWKNSAAVSSVSFYNPQLNYSDLDLFLFKYKPNNGDIIVDVGVENGSEIPEFCKLVGTKGKIFAIEADPSCCRRLKKLKKILNLENLFIIEYAVGDQNKKIKFSQEIDEKNNRVLLDNTPHQNFIEIKQLTFEEAIKSYNLKTIDFVKVNIEGAEMNLLKSLENSNLVIKNWCISCHDFMGKEFRTFDDVYLWLKRSNYIVNEYTFEKNKDKWRKFYLFGSKINI